jgi:hypothetical protein
VLGLSGFFGVEERYLGDIWGNRGMNEMLGNQICLACSLSLVMC